MLVVSGVTLASTFGPHVSTSADTMAEIITYFANPTFVTFAAVTLATVGACSRPDGPGGLASATALLLTSENA